MTSLFSYKKAYHMCYVLCVMCYLKKVFSFIYLKKSYMSIQVIVAEFLRKLQINKRVFTLNKMS